MYIVNVPYGMQNNIASVPVQLFIRTKNNVLQFFKHANVLNNKYCTAYFKSCFHFVPENTFLLYSIYLLHINAWTPVQIKTLWKNLLLPFAFNLKSA